MIIFEERLEKKHTHLSSHSGWPHRRHWHWDGDEDTRLLAAILCSRSREIHRTFTSRGNSWPEYLLSPRMRFPFSETIALENFKRGNTQFCSLPESLEDLHHRSEFHSVNLPRKFVKQVPTQSPAHRTRRGPNNSTHLLPSKRAHTHTRRNFSPLQQVLLFLPK